MNHLEGVDEILGRITPAFIEFTKQQNKKYKKSMPTYSEHPILSYQVEIEKHNIRNHHQRKYKPLRRMFPGAVIHHQWIGKSSLYDGVALVDGKLHHSNIIEIIRLLEGEITKFKHNLT